MAYNPPTADTRHWVGGLGDQTGKHNLNGGGCTVAAWATNSNLLFYMNANGSPIVNKTAATYTHATKKVTGNDVSLGVTVGCLVYLIGTNLTNGVYKITAVNADNEFTVADCDSTGDNTDTALRVGGALVNIDSAFVRDEVDATDYNRTVYDNWAETITGEIIIILNSGGGSITNKTWLQFIGCDSSLVELADGLFVLKDATGNDDDLLIVNNVSNTRFKHIYFKGDAGNFSIQVNSTIAQYNIVFEQCKTSQGAVGIHCNDADSKSLFIIGGEHAGINYGIRVSNIGTNLSVVDCIVTGTNFGAIYIANGIVEGCILKASKYGVHAIQAVTIKNNTMYDITDSGIYSNNNTAGVIAFNNIIDVAAVGSDYAINMASGTLIYEDYNITNATTNGLLTGLNSLNSQSDSQIGLNNPGSEDFSLIPNSIAFHAGKPTLNNGVTSMGAWQRKQYPMRIKMDGLV